MNFSSTAPFERCKCRGRLIPEVRHFDQIHTRGNDGGERCRDVEILIRRERDFTRSGQLSASPRDLAHPLNTHEKAAEFKIGVTCIVLYCIEWRTAMEKHFTTDIRSFRSLEDAGPCRLDGKNS